MITENITIVLNDVEYDAEVRFNFSAGEPRIIKADPNDCQDGCGDEYEIMDLYILEKYKGLTVPYLVNFLIDDMKEDIIEQLESRYEY